MGLGAMNAPAAANPRKVRFSDGGTFEVNIKGASDYLLDPQMIRFLFICIVLFGTLRSIDYIEGLELYPQILVWIVVFATTVLWLAVSVSINIKLVDRGFVSTIFTPLIVLPLAFLFVLPGYYVADLMNMTVENGQATALGRIVQNIIVLTAFDIFHGRFVAPMHPSYVAPQPVHAVSQPVATPFLNPELRPAPAGEDREPIPETEPVTESAVHLIEIANEKIDIAAIKFIKSEDHYLRIVLGQESLLLRGRLGETIEKIGADVGIQINRSVWIAFAEIEQVQSPAKGHTEILASDGTSFRVATSRKREFEFKFERFKRDLVS